MQKIKISKLIPHPRNNEFFDDMTGDKWKEFLESVRTSGVIEPIVVTQDMVIVSGHQRVRACKELGIDEVLVDIRRYENDDDVVKDLLETNMCQRGEVGGSMIKLGRRYKELKKIYGIKRGNNQYKEDCAIGTVITQEELVQKIGIDFTTLKRAEQLTALPQEIQDLVEQGNITPSTASRVIAKLTPDEQEQLIAALPVSKKLTQKEVEGYVEQIQEKDNQIKGYEIKLQKADEYKRRAEELEKELSQRSEPKVKTIIKEVVPDDYEDLKKQNEFYVEENNKIRKENLDIKSKFAEYEKKTPQYIAGVDLEQDCQLFSYTVNNFLKKTGGLAYLGNEINKLSDEDKESYIKGVQTIQAWAENILRSIEIK